MSKRFFSLLLVLTMVFSLAMPAMAASDDVAVITTEDFEKEYGEPGSAGAWLLGFVDTAAKDYADNNANKVYNSKAFADFKAAYEAAKKLIQDYNDKGGTIAPATLNDIKAAAEKAYPATGMSKLPDPEDITALQAKIKEVEDLAKTVTEQGYKLYIDAQGRDAETPANGSDSTLGSVYQTAVKFVKDYTDHTADAARQERDTVNNTETGLLAQLGKVLNALKDYVSAQTVSLRMVTSAVKNGKPTLKIVLTGLDAKKDDNHYTVVATVNGFTNTYKSYQTVTELGSAYWDNIVIEKGAQSNTGFQSTDPQAELTVKKGDTITVTLYTAVEREGWHEGLSDPSQQYILTEVDSKQIAFNDGAYFDKDIAGLSAAEFDTTSTDQIKATYVGDPSKDTGIYDRLMLKITAPNGKSYSVAATGTTQTIALTNANFVAAVGNEVPGQTTKQLAAGTYKVGLYGMSGTDAGVLLGKEFDVELKAVDTTDLEALVKEIEAIGTDKLASDYGNWNDTGDVGKYLKAAQDLLKKGAPIATNAQKTAEASKGPNTVAKAYDDLKTAYGKIYEVTELKTLINQALSLNPSDYTNWKSGTMEEALYAARHALLRATLSTTNMAKQKVDYDGNGKNDAITATYLTKAEYNKAVSDLKAAIANLQGDTSKVTGLQIAEDGKLYYYKDGEIQKTGYTEVPAGSGIYYYFSVKDGHAFKGGVVTGEGGKKYVADSTGVLQSGLVTVGSDAYYCSVKDHHIYRNGIVSAGGTRQYIAGKDGKLLKDKQTVGSNSYYCSVKDYHIWKAVKNTAWVTGTVAKYQINAKGVILATKPLKG